jgi:hypothetical protein
VAELGERAAEFRGEGERSRGATQDWRWRPSDVDGRCGEGQRGRSVWRRPAVASRVEAAVVAQATIVEEVGGMQVGVSGR